MAVLRVHWAYEKPKKGTWPSNAWSKASPEFKPETKPFTGKPAGGAFLLYFILLALLIF